METSGASSSATSKQGTAVASRNKRKASQAAADPELERKRKISRMSSQRLRQKQKRQLECLQQRQAELKQSNQKLRQENEKIKMQLDLWKQRSGTNQASELAARTHPPMPQLVPGQQPVPAQPAQARAMLQNFDQTPLAAPSCAPLTARRQAASAAVLSSSPSSKNSAALHRTPVAAPSAAAVPSTQAHLLSSLWKTHQPAFLQQANAQALAIIQNQRMASHSNSTSRVTEDLVLRSILAKHLQQQQQQQQYQSLASCLIRQQQPSMDGGGISPDVCRKLETMVADNNRIMKHLLNSKQQQQQQI
jgi:hypothetical protein